MTEIMNNIKTMTMARVKKTDAFFPQKGNICALATFHCMQFSCQSNAASVPASAAVYIRCNCIICLRRDPPTPTPHGVKSSHD